MGHEQGLEMRCQKACLGCLICMIFQRRCVKDKGVLGGLHTYAWALFSHVLTFALYQLGSALLKDAQLIITETKVLWSQNRWHVLPHHCAPLCIREVFYL